MEAVIEKLEKIVKVSNVDLLETLALEIIKEIKKLNGKIENVQVNIRKLAVPIDGIFDSVEIQINDQAGMEKWEKIKFI